MSENNYFEVIQNRLDALVDKIVQKENSDEEFRITYAQILEKINTKIDVFSNNDNSEQINSAAREIVQLIKTRQDIVDTKFNAIKGEFDNLNHILAESLKTPELLAAFNKIQNQIHYFSEEQENQKASFNSIISHIEKFGTLEDTNEILNSNFGLIKEQNTAVKDTIESVKKLNATCEANINSALDELGAITFRIKELSENLETDKKEIQTTIKEKIDSVITKIQESDSFVEVLNNNLTTMMQVVGNIFEDESFTELKEDVAGLLAKSEFLSESLKQIATKDELLEHSSQNKEEIKNNSLELITQLENNIFSKINVADIADLKDYTEKIYFQGTEVLKEEIWGIKDAVKNLDSVVTKKDDFDKNISTLKDEITDVISEESVAAAQQMKDITEQLENIKEEITDTVSEEALNSSLQLKDLSQQLDTVKEDITDIISEESVASEQQIKELTEHINVIKDNITDVITKDKTETTDQIKLLASVIENIKTELSQVILNDQNEQIAIALQNLQTKFVTQLVQIADNISFAENADEINDNIFSCTEELKDKILTDINEIKHQIDILKDVSDSDNENIVNLLNKIHNYLQADIGDSVKNITSKLGMLLYGLKEEKDYSYTMPDIESDLSKIRLELSNLQKTLINPDSLTEDHSIDIATRINDLKAAVRKMQESPITEEVAEIKALFTGLTEDISSISKRTNKLIISSDEVNKKLRSNIAAFTSLITAFEKQSKSFYNSAFLKDLNTRIEIITKGTQALMKSDEAMNEAFMYMGEWVDSASDIFENLQNDVTKIKKNLLADEENITERLERNLKSINQRLDEQEEKLNRLVEQQAESQELKSLLEYVASQVSITNEKIIENDQLTQKILSMEKQLKKIEKNIAVITEYIDEDDSYDD